MPLKSTDTMNTHQATQAKLAYQYILMHPMRLFFLTAALIGMGAAFSFWLTLDFVRIHRLLFLNILPAFAYAGFLLTAMPSWTGYTASLRQSAGILYVLPCLALLSLFGADGISAWLLVGFWVYLTVFCAFLQWKDRNTNHLSIVGILSIFVVLQSVFAYTQHDIWLNSQLHIHIAAIVLVSFRVSIVLGNDAVQSSKWKNPVFIPNKVYKNLAVVLLLIYAFAEWYLPIESKGFIALSVGCILLAKLRELHHVELMRKRYIRLYYLMQLFGAMGYLWLGVAQLKGHLPSAPLHLITITMMLSAIMLIFLTAGLRHSGLPEMNYPKTMIVALIMLFTAGVVRSLGMAWFPHFAKGYIYLPAGLLILVFALCFLSFWRVFSQNTFTDGE